MQFEARSAAHIEIQHEAPWGLARISNQQPHQKDYVYRSAGSYRTHVYVIDTGISRKHRDFQGRATFGARFPPGSQAQNLIYGDPAGHGTHVAGIVGSKTYGVSKTSHIVDVAVGTFIPGVGAFCETDDVIAGIQYAIYDAQRLPDARTKAVINLSLGFPAGKDGAQDLQDALTQATRDQMFVSCAAGNDGIDAANTVPASSDYCCTVGAIDEDDFEWEKSNYGNAVDIYAPGVNVESLSNQKVDGTVRLSPPYLCCTFGSIQYEGHSASVIICTQRR